MLKKTLLSTLILIFFLCNSVFADPVAVILGPEKIEPGQSAWLKTTGSKGKSFVWKILPPDADTYFTPLPIFGGMDPGPDGKMGTADDFPIVYYWAHFSSTKPGTYYFIFGAVENDKLDIAVHKIVNGEEPSPNPNPIPDLVITEPDEPYKSYVTPIIPLIKGEHALDDGYALARFFLDFSDVVGRDSSILKTTNDLRELNIKAGKLMFQKTGIDGRYAGLSDAIDKAFEKALTLQNVDLDDEKRQKAVKIAHAIGWATLEAAKKEK